MRARDLIVAAECGNLRRVRKILRGCRILLRLSNKQKDLVLAATKVAAKNAHKECVRELIRWSFLGTDEELEIEIAWFAASIGAEELLAKCETSCKIP